MKKVLFFLLLIAALIISNSLISSIITLWQKKNLVIEAQKQLDFQKQDNMRLKAQISYAQTPHFIEEQARNKLLLIKPNEEEILLPVATPSGDSIDLKGSDPNVPVWQQWATLFFGN